MKSELCKCNSCDTILIDENPQVNSPLLEIPSGAVNMVQLEDNGEVFWACPNCETDEFLTDLD